jgi:chromosome segregation ATPase
LESEKERVKNEIDNSKKLLEKEINLKKSLDITLKSLVAKTDELKNQKLNFEKRLTELKAEITNNDARIETVTNEIINVKNNLKENKTKLSNLKSDLKKLEGVNETLKKNQQEKNDSIKNISDTLNSTKLRIIQVNERKENLKLTSTQLQDKKSELMAEKHKMDGELIKTNDEINETKAEIENLEKNISKTESEINKKKSLVEEKCKALEKLNEKKSEIEIKALSHENSLKILDVDIKTESEKKIELERRNTEFVEKLTELRNLKNTELSYQNDILIIEKKLAQNKVEIERFKNDVEVNIDDDNNAILNEHDLVREKDDYNHKLDQLKDRKNFAKSEISRFKLYKSDCQRVIENSNEHISKLDNDLDNVNENYRQATVRLRDNSARLIPNHPIVNENNNEVSHYNR